MNMTRCLETVLRRSRRLGDSGMPLIEFVIALPVLIVMGVGTFEVGTYALLNLKVQSTAANVANLATRGADLSQAGVDDIFEAVRSSMAPFDVGDDSSFLITAVEGDEEGGAVVAWRRAGGGGLSASSRVSNADMTAMLPDSLSVGESTVIVVEGFYTYKEHGLGLVPESVVYKVVYYRPRLGALDEPT